MGCGGGRTPPLVPFLPFLSQGFRLPYEQPRDFDLVGLAWAPPTGPLSPFAQPCCVWLGLSGIEQDTLSSKVTLSLPDSTAET